MSRTCGVSLTSDFWEMDDLGGGGRAGLSVWSAPAALGGGGGFLPRS